MANIEWIDVDSSNVSRVAYHEDTETLAVQFHNGGIYSYSGVDYNTYQELVGASSVGQYLNRVIKVMYPYTRYYSENELISSIT